MYCEQGSTNEQNSNCNEPTVMSALALKLNLIVYKAFPVVYLKGFPKVIYESKRIPKTLIESSDINKSPLRWYTYFLHF